MSTKSSAMENFARLVFSVLPMLGVVLIVYGLFRGIHNENFDVPSLILLGLGHLFFLAILISKEAANLKFYLNVTIYTVAVVGIAVVIYLFAQQYTHRIDLSSQKFFSLADESVKYLKKLDDSPTSVTVTITILASDIDKPAFDDIIKRYTDVSKRVHFEVMDPNKDPIKARKLGDSLHYGDIFVNTSTGSSKKVSVNDMGQGLVNAENVLSNAIVQVTRKERPKIYFLGGHGELPYQESDSPGGAAPGQRTARDQTVQTFCDRLKDRAYETAKLNLADAGNKMPTDCSVLVIARPQNDLFQAEAGVLADYLAHHGKLLLLMPAIPKTQRIEPYTNLKALLLPYGIQLPDKLIIDWSSKSLGQNPLQPWAKTFDATCPITADLAKTLSNTIFFVSATRPVVLGRPPAGLTGWNMIQSSPSAWSQDMAAILANQQVQQPAPDEIKAQTIAAAVGDSTAPAAPGQPAPKTEDQTRLVVFGNDSFVQDGTLQQNAIAEQVMLNTINWLSRQDDMISIPRRELKGTPILLKGPQLNIIFLVAVWLIPEALFFGGLSYSFLRRRS